MGKNPAFQCYAADFIMDTADYSNRELGAYFRLLCHQWVNDKLPPDTKRLAEICRETSGGFMAIWLHFREKFPLCEDGFLRNQRMHTQRLNLENHSELQREFGRMGGAASAQKRKGASTDPTSDHTTEPTRVGQPLHLHTSTSNPKPGSALPPTPLPPWVNQASWKGFVDMRKTIRKPLTERARELLLKKLEMLRNQGDDPNAVIDQSTMNSWQGLFPLKEGTNGNSKTQSKNRAAIAGAFGDLVGQVNGRNGLQLAQSTGIGDDSEDVAEPVGRDGK